MPRIAGDTCVTRYEWYSKWLLIIITLRETDNIRYSVTKQPHLQGTKIRQLVLAEVESLNVWCGSLN